MKLEEIPVEVLPGVGEQKKEALAELGIDSVADLLGYFPYRYQDYRLSDLAEASHEERVTVEGQVYGQPSVRWYGKKKSRMTLRVQVDGVPIQIIWFNQAFLKNRFRAGQTIVVSGKWDRHRLQLTADRTFLGESEREDCGAFGADIFG